jgi:hypothetical protein
MASAPIGSKSQLFGRQVYYKFAGSFYDIERMP